MKVLIISDTHHGCHGNDPFYIDNQKLFLNNLLDIIVTKNKEIDTIVHTGDWGHKKTTIDKKTAHCFKPLYDELINLTTKGVAYFISGNHDNFYKQTNEHNMLGILFPQEEIIDMQCKKVGPLIIVPWINKSNREEIVNFIMENNKEGNYLFGHFNKKGAYMTSSYISEMDSIEESAYCNYNKVFSGHYHLNQEIGDWIFVGSMSELNKGDEASRHGVYILDTKTNEVEFIENKYGIYKNFNLSEESFESKKQFKKLLGDIKNKVVNIYINTKDNKLIEKISDVISSLEPYQFNLTYNDLENEDVDIEIKGKNINEIIYEYINNQQYKNNKELKYISKLWNIYYK